MCSIIDKICLQCLYDKFDLLSYRSLGQLWLKLTKYFKTRLVGRWIWVGLSCLMYCNKKAIKINLEWIFQDWFWTVNIAVGRGYFIVVTTCPKSESQKTVWKSDSSKIILCLTNYLSIQKSESPKTRYIAIKIKIIIYWLNKI